MQGVYIHRKLRFDLVVWIGDNDTLLSQCSAECETRDSATDNQNA